MDHSPGARPDGSYWWRWEAWHRKTLGQYREARQAWLEQIPAIETAWLRKADQLAAEKTPGAILRAFSAEAVHHSLEVLEQLHKQTGNPTAKDGGWLYRAQWKRWNRRAGIVS